MGACTYPSGHVDTLETVVRRAMVTGINQTAIDISLHNARQLNCRFMELSAHSGARTGDGGPDYTNHSWWQGQIVSLDGEPGYLSLKDIGYGDVRGFGGANCRHNWHLFWPGISTPAYTPEALAEYNAPKIPWKGQLLTEEQARQKQRALERQIRRAKRECIVAEEWGVPSEESAAKTRLARARARLNAYLEETGLKMDEGRTEVAREQQNAAYTARKATLLDIKSTRGSGCSTGQSRKTVHRFLGKVDVTDTKQIEALKDSFCSGYAKSNVEHMLVITHNGEVHYMTDNNPRGVDCSYLGDKLKGSYNIHTHPPDTTQYSFSTDADIPGAFADGTTVMEAVDYKYHYRFVVPKDITFEQWDKTRYEVEKNIGIIMEQRGYSLEDVAEYQQHTIIDEVCKRLGISAYSRWKR